MKKVSFSPYVLPFQPTEDSVRISDIPPPPSFPPPRLKNAVKSRSFAWIFEQQRGQQEDVSHRASSILSVASASVLEGQQEEGIDSLLEIINQRGKLEKDQVSQLKKALTERPSLDTSTLDLITMRLQIESNQKEIDSLLIIIDQSGKLEEDQVSELKDALTKFIDADTVTLRRLIGIRLEINDFYKKHELEGGLTDILESVRKLQALENAKNALTFHKQEPYLEKKSDKKFKETKNYLKSLVEERQTSFNQSKNTQAAQELFDLQKEFAKALQSYRAESSLASSTHYESRTPQSRFASNSSSPTAVAFGSEAATETLKPGFYREEFLFGPPIETNTDNENGTETPRSTMDSQDSGYIDDVNWDSAIQISRFRTFANRVISQLKLSTPFNRQKPKETNQLPRVAQHHQSRETLEREKTAQKNAKALEGYDPYDKDKHVGW